MYVYIITTAANKIVLDETYAELISVSSKNKKQLFECCSMKGIFRKKLLYGSGLPLLGLPVSNRELSRKCP